MLPNAYLNDLLIDVGRSLLQYVGESWPWTNAEEAPEKVTLDRLVAGQQESIAELADLLVERGHRIDFGSYPTVYTSLHYVALDYLLDQLVADQAEVVASCNDVLAAAAGDEVARDLLMRLTAREMLHLGDLRRLAAPQPA